MPIQIGEKALPTFAQPLALLSDCHRRIERFLRALLIVAETARGQELNAEQRDALQSALRYFREAAPKHTADEEESLFPRLRARGGFAGSEALAKLEALEADHVVAQKGHALVETLGRKWVGEGGLSPSETAQLLSSLQELHAIYQRHISVEDEEIFPLAGSVLGAHDLAAVGEEMARRRGQETPRSRRG